MRPGLSYFFIYDLKNEFRQEICNLPQIVLDTLDFETFGKFETRFLDFLIFQIKIKTPVLAWISNPNFEDFKKDKSGNTSSASSLIVARLAVWL